MDPEEERAQHHKRRSENHGMHSHADCENKRFALKRAQWTRQAISSTNARSIRNGEAKIMECMRTRTAKTTASHGRELSEHNKLTHKKNARNTRHGKARITECVRTRIAKTAASHGRELSGHDKQTLRGTRAASGRNGEAKITECVHTRTAQRIASRFSVPA